MEQVSFFIKFWDFNIQTSRVDVAEQSLIIIRSTKGDVFGAYCSASWSERNDIRERTRTKYFGTGESFVWHEDKDLGLPIIHRWAGQSSEHPEHCPQMFMAAGDRFLIVSFLLCYDFLRIRL